MGNRGEGPVVVIQARDDDSGTTALQEKWSPRSI